MSRSALALLPVLALLGCTKDDDTGDDTDVVDTEVVDTDVVDTDVAPLTVTVTPASPLAGDGLHCGVEGAGADAVTYAWTVDGVDAGIAAEDVLPGVADAYETWTCAASTEAGAHGEGSVTVGETCSSLHLDESADVGLTDGTTGLDLAGTSFTVEAWFLDDTEVVAGISEWALVARTKADNPYDRTTYDFGLMRGTNGNLRFHTGGAAGDCTSLETQFVARGCWHHVAATYDVDGGWKAIWVDGAMATSCATDERGAGADGPVVVGGLVQGPMRLTAFPGAIDEVRVSTGVRYTEPFTPEIYLRADADTRLLLHMNTTAPWSEDAAVRVVPDASGHGLDLKLGSGLDPIDATVSACDAPTDTCPVL